jgi:hypothetical protein
VKRRFDIIRAAKFLLRASLIITGRTAREWIFTARTAAPIWRGLERDNFIPRLARFVRLP